MAPHPRKIAVTPHTAEAESSSTAPPLLPDSLMGTSNPAGSELNSEMPVSDISTHSKEEAERKRASHLTLASAAPAPQRSTQEDGCS